MRKVFIYVLPVLLSACGSADDPEAKDDPPEQEVLSCASAALYASAHSGCEAMDAEEVPDPEGSCDCFLGYAWNGSSCVSLADCGCEGADCDKLTRSREECVAAHAECVAASPPTIPEPVRIACEDMLEIANVHDDCEAMDAEAVPDAEAGPCDCFLGYAWNGSRCVSLADCSCQGADCDKVTQSYDECVAAHAECPVVSPPETTQPLEISCDDAKRFESVHESCLPMEAEAVHDGEAACHCFLGYAWDGTACVSLADCSCQGADCDKLTMTRDECLAAHPSCPSNPPLLPTDPPNQE